MRLIYYNFLFNDVSNYKTSSDYLVVGNEMGNVCDESASHGLI